MLGWQFNLELIRLASNHLFFTSNFISARISILYKRPFRKEKEVVTFLIKDKMTKLAWNLRIERRPCQSEATEWALTREQAVCSLPTGTGKTLAALLWLANRLATPVEKKQARGS